jgi:TRAP-type mannitol/chloroaromatic compound transport system permease small subunit
MFSLSYAIIHRTHIRIDAAYQYMPAWLRAALDILGAALLTGFVAYVAYRGYFMLADTYENGSRSITPMRTPLAIPQTPWFAGMVFAVFTGLVMITAAIVAFFKGDFPYINKLLGIPSVDEQIEDET